jgi:Ca-activated chloride channel homolog
VSHIILAEAKSTRLALIAIVLLMAPLFAAQKERLPRERVLDHDVELRRDPSGELQALLANTAEAAGAPSATGAIRTSVELVEVGCTVTAPDGTRVRDLTRGDFRIFDDGVEQQIASFDAASERASIALLLDDSPSIYRELGQTREAARSLARSLGSDDEVALAAFAGQTHLLLPFSPNRALLAEALASPMLRGVADSSQSFIYQAIYLTAHALFSGRTGRKAIVLLTDGEDSGLGLTWDPTSMNARPGATSPLAFDDVARELSLQGVELYVISTEGRPKAMTDAWLAEHSREPLIDNDARRLGIPLGSLYLAEMVRQVGGGLYFLREIGGLAEVYRQIALALGAEYTFGYYPSNSAPGPRWSQIRVELRTGGSAVPAGARVNHRAAYYVPASH